MNNFVIKFIYLCKICKIYIHDKEREIYRSLMQNFQSVPQVDKEDCDNAFNDK